MKILTILYIYCIIVIDIDNINHYNRRNVYESNLCVNSGTKYALSLDQRV